MVWRVEDYRTTNIVVLYLLATNHPNNSMKSDPTLAMEENQNITKWLYRAPTAQWREIEIPDNIIATTTTKNMLKITKRLANQMRSWMN